MTIAWNKDYRTNSGEIMTTQNKKSIDRGRRQAVLEHLARYRLTVVAAMQQLPHFKRLGRKRTTAVLHQLCRSHEIGAAPLYRNRQYFFLEERGFDRLAGALPQNDSRDRYGSLSELAKIKNYAILVFCCLSGRQRQRLMPADFHNCFPDLCRPGLAMNYYVDTSGPQPRLGFIRVDTGGTGRWDRVLAKCLHDVTTHEAVPGFRPFIARQAFEVTLITPLLQKARRIAETVNKLDDPRANLIKVSAMPELLNLIAPPPW